MGWTRPWPQLPIHLSLVRRSPTAEVVSGRRRPGGLQEVMMGISSPSCQAQKLQLAYTRLPLWWLSAQREPDWLAAWLSSGPFPLPGFISEHSAPLAGGLGAGDPEEWYPHFHATLTTLTALLLSYSSLSQSQLVEDNALRQFPCREEVILHTICT